MIYNRFNREISCHHITASLHHCITASLCQSVICLVPCHPTSQSFALPPTTASPHHCVTTLVSHLPCPLPPNQSVICFAPCHQASQSFALPPTTTSLHHRITASPHHRISQSFALPPATKPVSHLPCPLPLRPRVTASPRHHVTTSPCHCITTSLHHRITTSTHHCVSQSFALPPATKPVSHLLCPLPPSQSVICLAPYHCVPASPRHHVTMSPHHHTTASPHHHVTASPHHRITVLVSHLPCPLPPNQSVISLAPCHQTNQSFALPPTTASPHHCATMPLHHHITASPCHHVTVLVSHLACPLPPNQSVICLAPCHQTSQSFALPPTTMSPRHHVPASPGHCITMSPHHHVTAPLHHCITASDFPHHMGMNLIG